MYTALLDTSKYFRNTILETRVCYIKKKKFALTKIFPQSDAYERTIQFKFQRSM